MPHRRLFLGQWHHIVTNKSSLSAFILESRCDSLKSIANDPLPVGRRKEIAFSWSTGRSLLNIVVCFLKVLWSLASSRPTDNAIVVTLLGLKLVCFHSQVSEPGKSHALLRHLPLHVRLPANTLWRSTYLN